MKMPLRQTADAYKGKFQEFEPFPRAGHPEGYKKVSPNLRKRILEEGESYLGDRYPSIFATDFMNFKRTGNRVASTLFGHKRVYFVVGKNKIAPDYDAALWRARNIASPKNAQRLGKKTPCAVKADKCYNCSSPERSCRALVVLWEKPRDVERMEVILIDEELGY